MSSNDKKPFVSVIVPVYNSEHDIEKNIQSLLDQNYPKDAYEIIIVDNGSTDTTRDVVKKYPVILLEEWEQKNSYTARNRGICCAQGEIIAFTDADCIADPNWIQHGVDFLTSSQLDSVGGSIEFTFSPQPTVAELVDSLINLDNQDSIKRYGIAKTANFFTYKKMFQEIGMFNELSTSGGDGQWTARAKAMQKTIGYCSSAIVYHPARTFFELIKKHVRVGGGSTTVWKVQNKKTLWIIGALAYLLTPLSTARIPKMVKRKNFKFQYSLLSIMVIAYICKLATAWGMVKSFFLKPKSVSFLHLPEPAVLDSETVYRHANWIDSIAFFLILARARRLGLMYYLLYAKCIAWTRSSVLVLEYRGKIIGGSIFSDMPLRLNQFDTDSINKMKELVLKGYCYGSSFFIDPRFRNQGLGTTALTYRSSHPKTKYYFTPSPRSRDLYVRMGAKEYYQGRHTLFLMEGTSPRESLVSIILPVYNRSKTIRESIESVLRQTYSNWELIIINDGSTDDTVSVVTPYLQDPRITLIHHGENRGIAAARNTGIGVAHGEYVAFLDSDDVWLPLKIEKQVRVFNNAGKKIGLVHTGVIIVNTTFGKRKKEAGSEPISLHSLRTLNSIGSPSRVMIRRECIEQCGLFNESLDVLEDRDMWMRIAARYSIGAAPEPLVEYYESPDSISCDTEKLIAGYKKFWDMYHISIASPTLYGIHTCALGHRLCYHGSPQKGRYYLRQSIRYVSFPVKPVVLLFLSYSTTQWYRLITFYITKYASL